MEASSGISRYLISSQNRPMASHPPIIPPIMPLVTALRGLRSTRPVAHPVIPPTTAGTTKGSTHHKNNKNNRKPGPRAKGIRPKIGVIAHPVLNGSMLVAPGCPGDNRPQAFWASSQSVPELFHSCNHFFGDVDIGIDILRVVLIVEGLHQAQHFASGLSVHVHRRLGHLTDFGYGRRQVVFL